MDILAPQKKIGVDILAPTSKDNLAPFTCILDRTIQCSLPVFQIGQFSTVHMYFRQDNLAPFTCILDRTIQCCLPVFQTGQFSAVYLYFRQDNLVLFTCILDRTIQCCLLVRLTGARCVRKKKNNNKILYNTTRGRTHLLPFF